MKLWLDQNISYKVVRYLTEKVPELTHVKFVGLLNAEDNEIWKFAKTNDYVIITFDADFYELQIIKGFPPKIVWIRAGNMTRSEFIDFLNYHIHTIREFLASKEFENIGCLEIR